MGTSPPAYPRVAYPSWESAEIIAKLLGWNAWGKRDSSQPPAEYLMALHAAVYTNIGEV